jgi:hypothetical protein
MGGETIGWYRETYRGKAVQFHRSRFCSFVYFILRLFPTSSISYFVLFPTSSIFYVDFLLRFFPSRSFPTSPISFLRALAPLHKRKVASVGT